MQCLTVAVKAYITKALCHEALREFHQSYRVLLDAANTDKMGDFSDEIHVITARLRLIMIQVLFVNGTFAYLLGSRNSLLCSR